MYVLFVYFVCFDDGVFEYLFFVLCFCFLTYYMNNGLDVGYGNGIYGFIFVDNND